MRKIIETKTGSAKVFTLRGDYVCTLLFSLKLVQNLINVNTLSAKDVLPGNNSIEGILVVNKNECMSIMVLENMINNPNILEMRFENLNVFGYEKIKFFVESIGSSPLEGKFKFIFAPQ